MSDPTQELLIQDWTWSTVPAQLLGLAPTWPGDQHVIVGMTAADQGWDGDLVVRRLTAEQALQLADALRARALVIQPPATATQEPRS